ncbi:MAG: sigma 54-interacting transcriptional regulator [Candidatus Zhuqueibacterota bacterium]
MNVSQFTSKHIIIAACICMCIAACLGLLFENVTYFYGLDADLLDYLIFKNNSRKPSDKLSLIVIDDESVREFDDDKSALRDQYTYLIQKLSSFGARSIAFDLFFGDGSEPSTDARLAFVTDSTRKVIHSFYFPENGPGGEYDSLIEYQKYAIEIRNENYLDIIEVDYATFPNANFIDAFDYAGFVSYECDKDGATRRMPLIYKFNGLIYPSLTLAAMFHYNDMQVKSIRIERGTWGFQMIIDVPNSPVRIPVDNKGQAMLNYYGTFQLFSHHPLHKTIKLLQSIQWNNGLDTSMLPFHDHIVLFGNTELNEGDSHNTPFSVDFPGVGLHATLISNILNHDFLVEAPWYINFLVTLILLIFLFCSFSYYLKHSKSQLFFSFLSLAPLLVLNSAYYFFIFNNTGIWLKLFQVNSIFMVLFFFLLFFEKIIHLKKLNREISDLEEKLRNKSIDLDKVNEQVRFQSEQLKIVTYFANELRNTYSSTSPDGTEVKDEFIGHLLENENILKQQIDAELQRYKIEKQILDAELLQLRAERQAFLNRNIEVEKVGKQPPSNPDKTIRFQNILSYLDYFYSQLRSGRLNQQVTMGIIAVPFLKTETCELMKTEMGELFDEIKTISAFKTTALINGESGTGKELIADAIHEQSSLKNKRMVKLDCGAIPETLLESELFGHTKGAYSGAHTDRKGAFLTADGSTIFLDEIGELKLDLQAKLLRVIQEKTIKKVGADTPIQVDVRIIAATNRDLATAVQKGEFRQDLYYRLNVVNLKIPPLRQRRWDVPFLIHFFLSQYSDRYGEKKSFTDEAYNAAMCYDWPGNIRELQNLIEKLYVTCPKQLIDLSDLTPSIQTTYREIMATGDQACWHHIGDMVQKEKDRLLDLCKSSLRSKKAKTTFMPSGMNLDEETNCYDALACYVDQLATLFPPVKKEALVRSAIVQMQEELFKCCHQEKIGKLNELYPVIEKILGRSRRQIDNWRGDLSENSD